MDTEVEVTRCEAVIQGVETQIQELSGVELEVLGTKRTTKYTSI